jgi:hypothetical protein
MAENTEKTFANRASPVPTIRPESAGGEIDSNERPEMDSGTNASPWEGLASSFRRGIQDRVVEKYGELLFDRTRLTMRS